MKSRILLSISEDDENVAYLPSRNTRVEGHQGPPSNRQGCAI